jgi:hypothetical protein
MFCFADHSGEALAGMLRAGQRHRECSPSIS